MVLEASVAFAYLECIMNDNTEIISMDKLVDFEGNDIALELCDVNLSYEYNNCVYGPSGSGMSFSLNTIKPLSEEKKVINSRMFGCNRTDTVGTVNRSLISSLVKMHIES